MPQSAVLRCRQARQPLLHGDRRRPPSTHVHSPVPHGWPSSTFAHRKGGSERPHDVPQSGYDQPLGPRRCLVSVAALCSHFGPGLAALSSLL